MTITDSVRSALEVDDKVESHLNPPGSFAVSDNPVPTGREEIWRFTPLKRLRGLHADAEFNRSTTSCTWNSQAGVRVEGVIGDEARALRGISGLVPNTRFAARVLAEVPTSLLIDVPAESELADPIVVELVGEDATNTEAGHVAMRFGAHSKAIVVINHAGSASMAAVVEIVVGEGADVTVVSIQDWADDAVHLAHHQALVGRDATYKHAAISFGGDVVRMDANVTYDGPGGSAELLGLYFADAGQHIEHRIFADHNAPRTKSNAIYKGALQGEKAHTVWVGNVLIRKVAEGIETFEENRNLILTDGCHADSIPNLEIETGDIAGAGHASATARFDDNQLFYLQSRGISEKESQRLVVHGFFNDLIRKVGVPSIEARLLATVEAELAKNVLKEDR
ncbi:Fe-S cluster assembly protein SufD [Nocardioides sp.]|uniref:Fe-S cluster assembly protein SufD n=1 Tax=Nocardioides sp. TaxID=35761 RepID=UPI002B903BC7|nr:Fe-S cluster assembly protein SufD [Nocardioides sp.]HXH78598.1 Fe-S cluster assembly protein SufD [Nocardioides sp.]